MRLVQLQNDDMRGRRINRISSGVLILLALTALLTVLSGLVWPPRMPEADEGTAAHIFQLSIAALLPVSIIVVGTADWQAPWRSARPLIVAVAITVLAFGGLYYLEHVR